MKWLNSIAKLTIGFFALALIGVSHSSCLAQALPNDTILYKTAPNGLKIHMVFLSKTPCPDYSCYEFLAEYKSNEYSDKKVIGKVGLTLGELRFDGMNQGLRYNGVSAEALQLLSDWIVENKDD